MKISIFYYGAFLWLFVIIFLIKINILGKNKHFGEIKSIKEYFFKKGYGNENNISPFTAIKIIALIPFLLLFSEYFLKAYILSDGLMLLAYILSFLIGVFLIIVNVFNFLFFPLFLIIEFFTLIYGLFYTFILKGTKGYSFVKHTPKTKILNKFKKLKKDSAENEFYKIKVRV